MDTNKTFPALCGCDASKGSRRMGQDFQYHCPKCGQVCGTHTGIRLSNVGHCEKCGTRTNWVVKVVDRWGYWCGCA